MYIKVKNDNVFFVGNKKLNFCPFLTSLTIILYIRF